VLLLELWVIDLCRKIWSCLGKHLTANIVSWLKRLMLNMDYGLHLQTDMFLQTDRYETAKLKYDIADNCVQNFLYLWHALYTVSLFLS